MAEFFNRPRSARTPRGTKASWGELHAGKCGHAVGRLLTDNRPLRRPALSSPHGQSRMCLCRSWVCSRGMSKNPRFLLTPRFAMCLCAAWFSERSLRIRVFAVGDEVSFPSPP